MFTYKKQEFISFPDLAVIVDASKLDTLRKPKGATKYKVVEDRKEIPNENNRLCERSASTPVSEPADKDEKVEVPQVKATLVEKNKAGVDIDSIWVNKVGRLRF